MKFRTLLIVLACPLVGCGAPFYTAAPIDAQIVDAESGQPIEGVVVVANWQLVRGTLDGTREVGQLNVKETATDRSGRFHLDGFTKVNPTLAELREDDPRILVFKPGYEDKKFSNVYPRAGTQTPGVYRTSRINGRVLRLKRYASVRMGSSEVFYPFLRIDMESVTKDCGWKKIPLMLAAMDRARAEIKVMYPEAKTGLVNVENLEQSDRQECGSAIEFLKGYTK